MNNSKTIFDKSKMSILLPITYEGMTSEMQEHFYYVTNNWAESYGDYIEFGASLSIDAWTEGQKYFMLIVYGYIDNDVLHEAFNIDLAPDEELFYWNESYKQILENYSK